MYESWARFYDLVYSFKDYAAEADQVAGIIETRRPEARSLLDVACGTGLHLERWRERWADVAGLDISPAMLEVARRRLPGVLLVEADMRSFDLGRTFDVVTCLFSSVGHLRSTADLERTLAAFAAHLEPGGLAIVEPWFEPEEWRPGHVAFDLVDEEERKIVRMARAGRRHGMSTIDFHFLVGTPTGIDHFTEHVEMPLFTRTDYEDAFRATGFDVEHEAEGLMGRGLFIGTRR